MEAARAGATVADHDRAEETQAHQEAVRMSTAELVGRLQQTLGGRLVAYLGDVKETRAVSQWATGDRAPSAAAVERFRVAYQAAHILLQHDSAGVVQAWFQGMNPSLEDEAPAWLLRREDLETAGPLVLAAARRFVAGG